MSNPSTSGGSGKKQDGNLRPFEKAKLTQENAKLNQEKASLIRELKQVGKKQAELEAEQKKEKKDAEARQALLKELGPLLSNITPSKRPHPGQNFMDSKYEDTFYALNFCLDYFSPFLSFRPRKHISLGHHDYVRRSLTTTHKLTHFGY